MRTTISLEEGLLEDAKRRASESGTTLSGLITRALRAALSTPAGAARKRPFRLVTHGTGGLRPGVSLERVYEILEAEDAAGLRAAGPRRRRA